jgi:hypothetical protein
MNWKIGFYSRVVARESDSGGGCSRISKGDMGGVASCDCPILKIITLFIFSSGYNPDWFIMPDIDRDCSDIDRPISIGRSYRVIIFYFGRDIIKNNLLTGESKNHRYRQIIKMNKAVT